MESKENTAYELLKLVTHKVVRWCFCPMVTPQDVNERVHIVN